jgi:DNA-binding transcriptional ArsR family regulator
MQQDEMVVTSPEQARALQDTGFLGRFLEPASPSDVARSLGIPANLARHHAKRHASLGLLLKVKRERGKVYYQLAAKTFKHHRSLLPVGDPDEHTTVMLRALQERFLSAYEYCDRIESGEHPNWHVYGFAREGLPEGLQGNGEQAAEMPWPAHFQARTLRLTPARYRELVRRIANLIVEAEADEEDRAEPCIIALLAMDGVLQEGSSDSHYLSTFVPSAEAGGDRGSWDI